MRYIRMFIFSLIQFIIWFFVFSIVAAMITSALRESFPLLKEITNFNAETISENKIALILYFLINLIIILVPVFFVVRVFVRNKFGVVRKEKTKKMTKIVEEEFSIPMQFINYFFSINASPEPIMIPNPFRSVFVTGTAGSGKTESIAYNLLQQAVKKNYSIIQYDFKSPTLTNYLESVRNEFNSDLKHFFVNFDNVNLSHRVNPLNPKFIPNSTYAREYASAIIYNLLPESMKKMDYWIRSATDLLTACIWYLRDEHPDKCTLPHVCNMILSDDKKLLELLQNNSQSADLTISIYNAMKRKADAQLSGVVGTLQSAIAKINTPEINYILSGNDFDLDINNPDNPKLVSIGSTPDLVDTFSPVISLIFTVAFKQMNKQNKHHSFVLLDEAPTLFIPKIESLPATARANKVSLCYMCQDISQMVDMFGQTKAEVIISNLNNQFWGKSTNPKSADHVSRLFGKVDKTYITQSESESSSSGSSSSAKGGSTSEGASYSKSANQSIQERPRIKPQQVLELETGQFYCTIADNKTKRLKWQINLPAEITPKNIQRVHFDFEPRQVQRKIKQDIQDIFESDLR